MRRDERGSAIIDFALIVGLVMFPFMGLIMIQSWPARLNAASAAAYEAARTAVTASDPAAGQDLGRERALQVIVNHGFDAGDVEVTYNLTDPGRGEDLTATVTITLPALTFPGFTAWDSVRFSRSNTQRVGDFRGFE